MRTCECVGRNSKPKSSQAVSSFAVPGIFLVVTDVDDDDDDDMNKMGFFEFLTCCCC
jgi:hypothetical protein